MATQNMAGCLTLSIFHIVTVSRSVLSIYNRMYRKHPDRDISFNFDWNPELQQNRQFFLDPSI